MAAPVFAVDTSCMVAAVCSWHEHHDGAAAAIEDRLDAGERLAVPAHAPAESYAVLTRLPAPPRLAHRGIRAPRARDHAAHLQPSALRSTARGRDHRRPGVVDCRLQVADCRLPDCRLTVGK